MGGGLGLHLEGGGGRKKKEKEKASTPRGHVAVMVGLEGEEKKRFVVPVDHLHHPLFRRLLEEAEEEYGFRHAGPIAIPRRAADFLAVQTQIDREILLASSRHGGGDLRGWVAACFRRALCFGFPFL